LPGIPNETDLSEAYLGTIQIYLLTNKEGFNLLMLSAKLGEAQLVQIFLKLGFDVNILLNNETPASLACKFKKFQTLLVLFKANSEVPPNFILRNSSDDIKSFFYLCRDFQMAVQSENLNEIRRIAAENPQLKHFYDMKNNSAASLAIKLRKLEIYKELVKLKICIARKEDMDEITADLSEDEKNDLMEFHQTQVKGWTKKHLMFLLANSFLCHDTEDADNYLEDVKQAFEIMNKIKEVEIVLKVVAASKNFQIIFDFNRNNIQHIDPSAKRNVLGSFSARRVISIGAKNLLDSNECREVYGTIAHELTHYASYLIYKNCAKPYAENEEEKRLKFLDIVNKTEVNKDKENIVDWCYKYYEKNELDAELIVRVPHMLTFHHNNKQKITECRENFKDLFDFYENQFMEDAKLAIPNIQTVAEEVNEMYERENEEIRMENEKYREENAKFSAENQKFHIKTQKQKKTIFAFSISTVGIIFFTIFAVFLTLYTFWPVPEKWSDLFEWQEREFLARNVSYQSEILNFRNLTGNYTKELTNLLNKNQMASLYDNRMLKIGEETFFGDKIYLTRKFHKIDAESHKVLGDEPKCSYDHWTMVESCNYTTLNFNNIKHYAEETKVFLLSAMAGEGKSTTFKQFARKLKKMAPLKWVQFIELKNHTETFKSNNASLSELRKILNLENDFERKLFEIKFEHDEVVFIWDGLDEVTPYKEYLLKLFKIIQNRTENIQFISTRDPLIEELVVSMNQIVYFNFAQYSNSDRDEFIENYLKFDKNFTQNETEAGKTFINEFIAELEPNYQREYNEQYVRNPLMLFMICEIFFNLDAQSIPTNLYELYEKFYSIKVDILIDEKGERAKDFAKNVLKINDNHREVHQIFAFKHLYETNEVYELIEQLNLFKIRIKPNDTELFDRVSTLGILNINSIDDFTFMHRTFAEFLVAKFFIDNVFINLMPDAVLLFISILRKNFVLGLIESFTAKLSHEEKLNLRNNFYEISEKNFFYQVSLGDYEFHEFNYLYRTLDLSNETDVLCEISNVECENDAEWLKCEQYLNDFERDKTAVELMVKNNLKGFVLHHYWNTPYYFGTIDEVFEADFLNQIKNINASEFYDFLRANLNEKEMRNFYRGRSYEFTRNIRISHELLERYLKDVIEAFKYHKQWLKFTIFGKYFGSSDSLFIPIAIYGNEKIMKITFEAIYSLPQDNLQRTGLYFNAVENLVTHNDDVRAVEIFFNFTEINLRDQKFKKLLTEESSYQKMKILHFSFLNLHENVTKFVIGIYEEKFGAEKVIAFFLQNDIRGTADYNIFFEDIQRKDTCESSLKLMTGFFEAKSGKNYTEFHNFVHAKEDNLKIDHINWKCREKFVEQVSKYL
jgi:hypothetical protein